jgi:hypothetical protein
MLRDCSQVLLDTSMWLQYFGKIVGSPTPLEQSGKKPEDNKRRIENLPAAVLKISPFV